MKTNIIFHMTTVNKQIVQMCFCEEGNYNFCWSLHFKSWIILGSAKYLSFPRDNIEQVEFEVEQDEKLIILILNLNMCVVRIIGVVEGFVGKSY